MTSTSHELSSRPDPGPATGEALRSKSVVILRVAKDLCIFPPGQNLRPHQTLSSRAKSLQSWSPQRQVFVAEVGSKDAVEGPAFSRKLTAALLLLVFIALFSLAARAEKIADLKPTGYVNDFAGVLSPETRSRLETLCTEVDRQAHAQIAVVTIHTTGDDTIDDFAVRLEEKWKVGPKVTDRGLLLLVATDDHHYRFEVGYGLEGILPDGKVGSIGREMVPYLRQGNYDAAITLGTQDVAQVIAKDAGVTLSSAALNNVPQRAPHPLLGVRDIFLVIFVIFVFLSVLRSGSSGWGAFLLGTVLGNILGGGGRGGGGGDGGGFGGFGGGSSGGGGASGSW